MANQTGSSEIEAAGAAFKMVGVQLQGSFLRPNAGAKRGTFAAKPHRIGSWHLASVQLNLYTGPKMAATERDAA